MGLDSEMFPRPYLIIHIRGIDAPGQRKMLQALERLWTDDFFASFVDRNNEHSKANALYLKITGKTLAAIQANLNRLIKTIVFGFNNTNTTMILTSFKTNASKQKQTVTSVWTIKGESIRAKITVLRDHRGK